MTLFCVHSLYVHGYISNHVHMNNSQRTVLCRPNFTAGKLLSIGYRTMKLVCVTENE